MEKTITTEFFGIKLKAARKFKKMTQLELASKLEVAAKTISGYESSFSYPTLETFAKLCSVLDVSPEYFLSTSDNFPFKMLDLDEEQMESIMSFIALIELSNAVSFENKKQEDQ